MTVAAVLAVLAVLAAASCTMVNGLRDTQRSLASAGFADVRVDPARDVGSAIVLDVRYRTAAAAREAVAEEQLRVAEIVWREAPLRFDRLRVRATNEPAACAGRCRIELSRADLESRFGARDPALDQDVLMELLLVGAAVLLAIVLGVSLIAARVVRARASSRQRHEPWDPGSTVWRGTMGTGAPTSRPTPLPPGPPTPSTERQPAPSPYGDVSSAQGVPAAPERPQSWQDPGAAPAPPEPTYDIWERPPS